MCAECDPAGDERTKLDAACIRVARIEEAAALCAIAAERGDKSDDEEELENVMSRIRGELAELASDVPPAISRSCCDTEARLRTCLRTDHRRHIMTSSIARLIRLALAVALGLFIGKAFGNRYPLAEEALALGTQVWEPSLAVQRAAQIASTVVGALLGVLSLTPWMRNTTRGLALLRGAVVAVLLALIASRVTGLFSEKFLPALAAFAVVGALLASIRGSARTASRLRERRSRVATLRPALARGARSALVGFGVALVPSLLLLASGPGLAFALCLALPPLGALVGFGIGVLIPANG